MIELRRSAVVRLGPLGVALAVLTVLAAACVALLLLFGKILVLSAAVSWLWPKFFSSDFTRWVFGTERVSFWKAFGLLLLAAFAARLLRRR